MPFLILAVSPLYFSQSHKTVFYFETIISSELKWNKYHTHWSPILAHTKVSVYLTGFRNAQFRSVTLRKSISWNFAPEEKIILFPPAKVRVYLTGFRNAQFRSVTLRKSINWNFAPEEKTILFPPVKCTQLIEPVRTRCHRSIMVVHFRYFSLIFALLSHFLRIFQTF